MELYHVHVLYMNHLVIIDQHYQTKGLLLRDKKLLFSAMFLSWTADALQETATVSIEKRD